MSIEARGIYFLKNLLGKLLCIGIVFKGEASIRERLINNHILKISGAIVRFRTMWGHIKGGWGFYWREAFFSRQDN